MGFIPEKCKGSRTGTSHARKTNKLGVLIHISAPPPWREKGQEIEFNQMAKTLSTKNSATTEGHWRFQTSEYIDVLGG